MYIHVGLFTLEILILAKHLVEILMGSNFLGIVSKGFSSLTIYSARISNDVLVAE